MSRYVLMQEQLDGLLDQIRHLNRVNEAKDERIKDLERHRILVSGSENADLVLAIGELEDEIHQLRVQNKQLTNGSKDNMKKIAELENLLEEERKLREYSETFAKEIEQQCAKETLVRELTTELCQLQKDEIEIENRRILELQKKIKKLSKQVDGNHMDSRRNSKNSGKESTERVVHMKSVLRKLQAQLIDLYGRFGNNGSNGTDEDENHKRKVETWLQEIGDIMEELNEIQDIRNDLSHMKNDIEYRRKSSPFVQR